MKMNCFIQITKCLRFPIFIKGAQAVAPPHGHSLCSYATAGAHFFTSYDKACFNGETVKKPLWNLIFFFNLDHQMK